MSDYITACTTSFLRNIASLGKDLVDGFYQTPRFSFLAINNHITFLKIWPIKYFATDIEHDSDDDVFDEFVNRLGEDDYLEDDEDIFLTYYRGMFGREPSKKIKGKQKRFAYLMNVYKDFIRHNHTKAVHLSLIGSGNVELLKDFEIPDIGEELHRSEIATEIRDPDTAKFFIQEDDSYYTKLAYNTSYEIVKMIVGNNHFDVLCRHILETIIIYGYFDLLTYFSEEMVAEAIKSGGWRIKEMTSKMKYRNYIRGYQKTITHKNLIYNYLVQ